MIFALIFVTHLVQQCTMAKYGPPSADGQPRLPLCDHYDFKKPGDPRTLGLIRRPIYEFSKFIQDLSMVQFGNIHIGGMAWRLLVHVTEVRTEFRDNKWNAYATQVHFVLKANIRDSNFKLIHLQGQYEFTDRVGRVDLSEHRIRQLAPGADCRSNTVMELSYQMSWEYITVTIRLLAQLEGHKDVQLWSMTHKASDITRPNIRANGNIKEIMDPIYGLYDVHDDSIMVEVEIQSEIRFISTSSLPMSDPDILRMRKLLAMTDGPPPGADVQFLVGSTSEMIYAHQYVLGHYSDVFKTLFGYYEKVPIPVPDVGPEAFRLMLIYCYTCDVSEADGLNEENMMDVLNAAAKYNLPGLLQRCVYIPKLDIDNVLPLLNIFNMEYGVEGLKERFWKFIDRNIYEVLAKDEFLEFSQELLVEFLGRERDQLMMSRTRKWLPVHGELAVWKGALRWADGQCRQKGLENSAQNWRFMLGQALDKIRFKSIPKEDFEREIVSLNVLSEDEVTSVRMYHLNLDHDSKKDAKKRKI